MSESTALGLLPRGYSRSSGAAPFNPYCPELLSPNTVALLLAGAVDSWDKLRQAASSCLMRLPTPLPGLASGAALGPLLGWAVGLLGSPRMRESDAGARLIKILYAKYVAQHRWRLELAPLPRALPPPLPAPPSGAAAGGAAASSSAAAVLGFLQGLVDAVEAAVAAARADLLGACRRSLAHGPLLLLRYVAEDVPWQALSSAGGGRGGPGAGGGAGLGGGEVAAWAARALGAAEDVVELALPVLSRPQERNVGAEEVDASALGSMSGAGAGGEEGGEEGDEEGGEGEDALGPESQVIQTACWTSVKEVALVLATLVRQMPLPPPPPSSSTAPSAPVSRLGSMPPTPTAARAAAGPDRTISLAAAAAAPGSGSMASPSAVVPPLSVAQLSRIGDLLVRLLFDMKHNGAVEKTALALSVVAERLLRAPSHALNALPKPWLEACLARVMAPRQTRDDIVRRSAGLPYALTALFLAEPSNAPKQLLPRAMTALLAIASAACSPHLTRDEPHPDTDADPTARLASVSGSGAAATAAAALASPASPSPRTSAGGGEAAQGPVGAGAGAEGAAAVVVVEGFPVVQVWPVVHAFNCLRHAFNDSHLAVDTSGYFAQAIQACLLALRSPWWEIRNSAQLCFTALTTRVLGFKNDSHGEAVRKAVSGAEFFARYPPLHGFLLGQLREAAAQLEAASAPAPALAPAASEGAQAAAVAVVDAAARRAALAHPHPGLYPVLIILSRLQPSHIRAAAEEDTSGGGGGGEAGGGKETETGAAAADGGAAAAAGGGSAAAAAATYMGALTPVAFTPLVRRCCTAAPLAVRRLAARALVPLVAAPDVPPLLQQLLAGVPAPPPRKPPAEAGGGGGGGGGSSGGSTIAAVLGSRASSGGPPFVIFTGGNPNALHGSLLAAAALLESCDPAAAAAAAGGGDAAADVLYLSLPPLVRGAWLADPAYGCSAMGSALLAAAAAALQLVPPGRCLEFRASVAELAAACREAVSYVPPAAQRALAAARQQAAMLATQRQRRSRDGRGSSSGMGLMPGGAAAPHNVFVCDWPDPMRSCLLKQAAALWLGPVLQCQAFRSSAPAGFFLEGLLHQLACCLASPLYDVRASALKAFCATLTAVAAAVTAAAAAPPPPPPPSRGQSFSGSGGLTGSGGAATTPSGRPPLPSSAATTPGRPPLSPGPGPGPGPTSSFLGGASTAAPATAAALAAAVTAAAAGRGGGGLGGADPGGKLARIVSDLASRPVLLGRLVSEGMSLLWGAVGSEPVHKVTRRALKALGLLHSISSTLAAAAAATAAAASPAPGRPSSGTLSMLNSTPELHPVTGEPLTPLSPPQRTSAGGGGGGSAPVTPTAGMLLHPYGCVCCPPGGAEGGAGASAALQAALGHVGLVQRVLSGSRELEARCEALRCLGRALGSALAAADAVAAAGGDGAAAGLAVAERLPQLVGAMGSLVALVSTAAAPWQPEDWRLAGAEALAASRLLQAAARRGGGSGAGGAALLSGSSSGSALLSGGGGGGGGGGGSGISRMTSRIGSIRSSFSTEAAAARAVAEAAALAAEGIDPEAEEAGRLEVLALRGWRCVITMLEDEDHAVRYAGARLAQSVMEAATTTANHQALAAQLSSHQLSTATASTASSSRHPPLYVEVVIRLLYPWLAVHYGGYGVSRGTRTALVEMLLDLVTTSSTDGGDEAAAGDGGAAGPGDGSGVPEIVASLATRARASAEAPAPGGGGSAPGPAPSSRRLFDKEADNPHEEPTLAAQLAARTLRSLLAAPPQLSESGAAAGGKAEPPLAAAAGVTVAGAEKLTAAAATAAERLGAVAAALTVAAGSGAAAAETEAVVEAVAADGWLGGFVNHPEVFDCSYRALLTLWALGPVRQDILPKPPLAEGGAEAEGAGWSRALAATLAALAARDDVAGSQLAPALEAAAAEWGEASGAGVEVAEAEAAQASDRRILFLL